MATRKATSKKAATKTAATKKAAAKTATKKTPAKKAVAKRSTTAKAVAGKTAVKAAAGTHTKTAAKTTGKKSAGGNTDNYTKPELREKIKKQVLAGDKGGHAGEWSARKAQMVAHEYEAEGGGYKHPRNAAQKSLKNWGEEHWHTADGTQAIQGDVTHRYLPDAAWKELSPEEKKATDRKKVSGSRRGKQFVANTTAASKARKHATKS